jgi:hypothetical protein
MDSILLSIKKLLGIEPEYTQFDQDIMMNINSVLMVLNQLGVGPTAGFTISSDMETWQNLLGDSKNIEAVKIYVYLKTRLLFDPPSNSFLVDAINRQITELEWRINIQVDKPVETTTTTE